MLWDLIDMAEEADLTAKFETADIQSSFCSISLRFDGSKLVEAVEVSLFID